MKFGSICSGIEAASVALHPLGWQAAWLGEIDPFASAVLAHRYPDVPNLGDMTTIAARVLSGEVDAPDALIGGTPCQAFSVAGLRGGLSDARGQLTISFVELANAIDTTRAIQGKRPAVIWWENVPGVLSSKDNAFGCFLAGLVGESSELQPAGRKWPDAGCVFGPQRAVAWRVLDAQYFGLAQRRRRVFVVASADPEFNPASVLFEFEGVRRDSPPSREAREEIAGTLASRTDGGGFPGTDEACSGYLQPCGIAFQSSQSGVRLSDVHATLDANNGSRRHNGVICMAHGQGGAEISEERCPTLTCNHEAPIAAYAFQPRIARNGRGDMGEVVNALTAQAGETGKGDAAPCAAISFEPRYYCRDNKTGGAPADTVMLTSQSKAGDSTPHVAYTFPAEMSATQCASEGDVSQALSVKHTTAVCITGDITHTLRAEGFDASEDGTGRGQPIVANRMAVRRLMPVETERLQGFPDHWTLIPQDKLNRLVADELAFLRMHFPDMPEDAAHRLAADGPRYKALGNSMAVPVIRWIGARITAEIQAQPDLNSGDHAG